MSNLKCYITLKCLKYDANKIVLQNYDEAN